MNIITSKITELLSKHNEKVDLVELEKLVCQYWDENKVFDKSLLQTEDKEEFVFLDGPPFATGSMHYGHILVSIIKDIYGRYKTMNGYHVSRRAGWDTHGVPIEMLINKKLNISTQKDVDDFGIGNYNNECRKVVMQCANEWESGFKRLGRWVDCDDDYKTMDKTFMESIWWVFNELYKKGLIYKGFKIMPYSTGCTTALSNHESGLNYKDVVDQSVIAKFELLNEKGTYLLAWTTTPWTLPDNMALCVGKDMKMTKVNIGNEKYIMSKTKYEQLKIKQKMDLLSEFDCSELVGLKYIPPFDYHYENYKDNAFIIVSDSYVKDDSKSPSTGIVHLAPAYGDDDFRVCIDNGIIDKMGNGMVLSIDGDGMYKDIIVDFVGKYVKDKETEKMLFRYLSSKNKQFGDKLAYKHQYPYCWRTDTPLLYMAVSGWFVNVEKIKSNLIENNKKINWMPESVGTGRFNNWLESACDWCISRSRYWGTPIPVWTSDDAEEVISIGSIEELSELSGIPKENIVDLHRENIDQIKIPSKQGKGMLKRISFVLDCWFESGAMPYAQNHYPFDESRKSYVDNGFPADFITESCDQTRGWFYTLNVLSIALFNVPAFKNVIVTGLVLAEDGQKMSKSKQNYPDPNIVIEKYGADALRLYLLNSPVVKAESLCFNEDNILKILRITLIPYYHSFKFFSEHCENFEQKGNKFVLFENINQLDNFMDKWIISRTGTFIKNLKKDLDSYKVNNIVSMFQKYIDHYTNWYVKFNRDRLKGNLGNEEWSKALSCMHYVLYETSKALAPIIPFLSEVIYQQLNKYNNDTVESVHLCAYPNIDYYDKDAEMKMEYLESVVDTIRQLRSKANISLRKPVAKVFISHPNQYIMDGLDELKYYLLSETNIMDIQFIDSQSITSSIKYSTKVNMEMLKEKLKKENMMKYFKQITTEISKFDPITIDTIKSTGIITLTIDKNCITLTNEIVNIVENLNDNVKNVVIENYYTDKLNDNELIYNFNNNFFIAIETRQTKEMFEKYICKLVHINIQKLRKEADLHPWDNVIAYYRSDSNELKNIVENNIKDLCESTKTQIQYDDNEINDANFKDIIFKTIDIVEYTVGIKLRYV
jgi:isoleucyl-tRNA synthetase